MSAAIVRQALEFVDPSFKVVSGKKKSKAKKGKEVFDLISDNQKLFIKRNHNKKKAEKVNLLSTSTKYTVVEAKKLHKSKEQRIKENLKKLKLIRKACTIELDRITTKQIIDRGITKRPVKARPKSKPVKKTAFTEEDFKKFEEEYAG
ncbi:unnamed protein product [Brassicogethes aeneus]|uniref:Active regulator of SIRT1 n=1 Tax=Brassicogethes aeneus TaxID=1431903 RepID=A0A9P0ARA4_BRAAE|nr:unnamed protein product [Brassicogethes aeneus]